MNLLITTLGTSWQIVPELLSITNPEQFDFFCESPESKNLREQYHFCAVDECWIITTEGQRDTNKLKNWAEHWNFKIKFFICNGVDSFANQDEIMKMRSLIYRVVLFGSEKSDTLYLSLSGGRKTMSADMQEAGNLFGCDAMIHVADKDFYNNKEMTDKIKSDLLLEKPDKTYSNFFVPLLVNEKIAPSLVVSADEKRLTSQDFPLKYESQESIFQIIRINEDRKLEREIQNRKNHSSQLYSNFYSKISSNDLQRDLFKKLYFLHPDILRQLKEYRLGENPERDWSIINRLPKAELHSHIGGLLSPNEIIEVAKTEKESIKKLEDCSFKHTVEKILSYENNPKDFETLIYGDLLIDKNFYKIGIDRYQNLGDFQGSSILQTKNTIKKTLEIYASHLIKENVQYLELRCSPYKYTKLGLSQEEVLDCIISTLNSYCKNFTYKLIYIIGRQSTKDEIKKVVEELKRLINENPIFAEKIVGIDLAGNEGLTKPSELREEFMPFLEKCMHITIHAGETEEVDSIWEAVYHLSADRIGHGLNLKNKPELMKRFIDKNIGVEMCPSSNDQIVGFSENENYPLLDYLKNGLKVTLNTDDCGISRTTLSNEFIKASKLCGNLTLWDCIVLIRNSLSIAFCSNDEKGKLMRKYENEILEICNEEFAL